MHGILIELEIRIGGSQKPLSAFEVCNTYNFVEALEVKLSTHFELFSLEFKTLNRHIYTKFASINLVSTGLCLVFLIYSL